MMGMVKFFLAVGLVGALLCLPLCAATALGGTPSYSRQDQQPEEKPKEKKKDKKKKGEPEPGSSDSADAAAAARRAISHSLRDFADGFEGHSARRVTDFLDEKFEDRPRFEDAVTEFLERTSEMRINFRESTNEVKGDHATVIVDAEMIYTDKAKPTQDQRRRQRIQFDLVYNEKKGWKIFEITPRDFFEP
jgi:hypothetical protein